MTYVLQPCYKTYILLFVLIYRRFVTLWILVFRLYSLKIFKIGFGVYGRKDYLWEEFFLNVSL